MEFEVGGKYRNNKGEYEVLSTQRDTMVVRYDDGTEQTLSKVVQSRINMNAEAKKIHHSGLHIESQSQSFYWSLGFLLARRPTLLAFVPDHALSAFRDKFYEATGRELSDDEPGVVVHPPETDKRWYELRATFRAQANELPLLQFGRDVNIVEGTPDHTAWNLNNNRLLLTLLGFGFQLGSRQDRAKVEAAILPQYRAAFDTGYAAGMQRPNNEETV